MVAQVWGVTQEPAASGNPPGAAQLLLLGAQVYSHITSFCSCHGVHVVEEAHACRFAHTCLNKLIAQ